MVTGSNGVGTPASASATVNIGSGPIVNAVTNFDSGSTIYANGGIIVWGNGFSRTGGNSIQLTRPGYGDVWLYAGDGDPNYWDQSHFQINAGLQGRAAPGQWTLYVRNGYSGTPSPGYNLTIVPGP
jgi:hypothetical protein